MKSGIAIASLAAILLAFPALAQPASGMEGPSAGMGSDKSSSPGQPRQIRDCTKSRNPEACAAHQDARRKADDACKGRKGIERRACYHEQMQTMDCSRSAQAQRCEARKQAYGECKGEQSRQGFKQCVQQKMPAADCAGSQNPMLCDRHNRAREMCKDKQGQQEHRACLREQLVPVQ